MTECMTAFEKYGASQEWNLKRTLVQGCWQYDKLATRKLFRVWVEAWDESKKFSAIK